MTGSRDFEELASAVRQHGVLAARRRTLARWHWIQRRRLARVLYAAQRDVLFWAPGAVQDARGAVTAAEAARRWGRTELTHPRQHVREAAAALLEAIGEPVPGPGPQVLLSDLGAALGAPWNEPGSVVAWDDLARQLKDRMPGAYPVLTGSRLRSAARAAGVAELKVAGQRRLGTSCEAVSTAQEASR